jgi:hypothetical protein
MDNYLETNAVLRAILEMLKEEAQYLHRQHRWIIAVSETIEQHPDFAANLKAHPFFDQGPRPDEQRTQTMIRNIDALIRQLKD